MGLRALLQQKSPRLRGFIISGLCLKQKGESLTLSRSLYRCLVFSDCAHTLWISPSKAAEADATSGELGAILKQADSTGIWLPTEGVEKYQSRYPHGQ
jgi:hypothetical protein